MTIINIHYMSDEVCDTFITESLEYSYRNLYLLFKSLFTNGFYIIMNDSYIQIYTNLYYLYNSENIMITNRLYIIFMNFDEKTYKLVKYNGKLLKDVDNELKNNKQFVKMAILSDCKALEFASDELKNDIELVKIAIKYNPLTIKYASIELQNNDEVRKYLILKHGKHWLDIIGL
jgi:hypothetical protein